MADLEDSFLYQIGFDPGERFRNPIQLILDFSYPLLIIALIHCAYLLIQHLTLLPKKAFTQISTVFPLGFLDG
jgi:hypothetical protein